MGRTEEFLGWVAFAMGDKRELAWWDIPRCVQESKLRLARVLTATVLTGLVAVTGTAIAAPGSAGWFTIGAMVFTAVVSGQFIGPGRLQRTRPPLAMVPRRPRSARETAILAAALLTGLAIRGTLRRQWIVPVSARDTPDSSYRNCRLSSAVDLAACLYTGVPLAVLGLTAYPGVLGWAAMLSAIMVLTGLNDGMVFPVVMTELVLLVRWRRWVPVRRTLREAARRGILIRTGPCYEFADPAERERLVAGWTAVVLARSRRIPDAVAAADTGARRWLLGRLDRRNLVRRVCLDLAIGITITPLTAMFASGTINGEHVAASVLGPLFGGLALTALIGLASWARRGLRWSLWRIPEVSGRALVAAAAVASLAADLPAWLAGPGQVRHGLGVAGVALLPGTLVAVTGGWVCVLAYDRWHEARSLLFRHVWDTLAAAVTCVALLMLTGRWPVSLHAVAGVLLPAAVWLSIRAWRAMNDSDRIAVRACADLTVSVLVGGSLAVALVWLADLLDMPRPEVTALREVAEHAAVLIDIPWWSWLTGYALLAGASLAFALKPHWLTRAGLGPGRLAAAGRRLGRWRVVPATEVIRRVTSGVHIGLLMLLLIGLAGQVVVTPVLRARLADRYTLTLADQERARAELAAYTEIRHEFTGAPPSQSALAPLADLVTQIHHVGDVATELDLARRLGELEATTVATPPGPARTAEPAPTGDGDEQLAELNTAAEHDDDVKEQVEQAAELASSAIAQALGVFRIGEATIVQIIREFIGGLIEASPLKDKLAEHVVVPKPETLKAAADAELARQVETTPVTDRTIIRQLEAGTGVAAAVKAVNQIRYLQEDSGPCQGCAAAAGEDDEGGSGTGDDDHPVEPPPEVP